MTYKCNFADYTKDGKKCKRKGNLEGICALKQSKPDLKPNDKYYRNVNFPSIGSY